MIDREEALNVAREAARAGGEVLLELFRKPLIIGTKSSARDLVTNADQLAQEAILRVIRSHYPDHRFLTEEDGAEHLGDPASPYAWIIDPLDGTTNFVHNKQDFGVLIALEEAGTIIVSVLYAPLTAELFHAVLKKGAYRNGEKLRVRKTKGMIDAILCTNTQKREKKSSPLISLTAPECGALHNYGSALHEMIAVAVGENDGVFFDGVGLWDIAAGCLLITEAGGAFRYDIPDRKLPLRVRCVASTKKIFKELCEFTFNR